MRGVLGALVVGMASIVTIRAAVAQDMDNPKLGYFYAKENCAECHEVRAGMTSSPHPRVPSFQTVADTPGMNAMALNVWFETAHRSMPDIVIGQEDGDDVIAYILSLRKLK